jgi:hypothetical protein
VTGTEEESQLFADPLRRDILQVWHGSLCELERLGHDRKAGKLAAESRQPQHPERIAGEGALGGGAQPPCGQIVESGIGIHHHRVLEI